MRLHWWLLKSPAYRSLNPTARAVLVEVYRRHNGSNNGNIPLSIREAAAAVNVTKDTAHKALHDLQERGFIQATWIGEFHLKIRHATKWLLTEFDREGRLGTRDFMRWRPEPEKKKSVPLLRTDGPDDLDAMDYRKLIFGPHSPKILDRRTPKSGPDGPSHLDTTNLPSGARTERSFGTDRSAHQPTCTDHLERDAADRRDDA